jgi:hypothetical protein
MHSALALWQREQGRSLSHCRLAERQRVQVCTSRARITVVFVGSKQRNAAATSLWFESGEERMRVTPAMSVLAPLWGRILTLSEAR